MWTTTWSRSCSAVALALTLLVALGAERADAQATNEEAIHEELRALRDAMIDAWMRRDLDGVLVHVDPNVVVTWQNGEVSRGHEGIRGFYDEVLGAEDAVIASIESSLEMEELSILHGADMAVAYGTISDEITFNREAAGASFIGADTSLSLDSRWTASLARKNGRWQLTAYHVSVNMFSNPVMSLAMSATRWIAGGIGLVLGIVLALLGARLVKARRPASAA